MAILETCKAVRSEAATIFYAEAQFIIENGLWHDIDQKCFEIDPRIAHLTIVLELWIELWPETNNFLERHFRAGGLLRELKICNDGFDEGFDGEGMVGVVQSSDFQTDLPQMRSLRDFSRSYYHMSKNYLPR